LTGFQENGHLGTLARYAIDIPQHNYAVFKVLATYGCDSQNYNCQTKILSSSITLNYVINLAAARTIHPTQLRIIR
jgi:hypothetical protein